MSRTAPARAPATDVVTLDEGGCARTRGAGTARRAAPHPLLAWIALVSCIWGPAACGPSAAKPPDPPAGDACAAAERAERVDAVESLEFHSAFWVNLHHVLWATAWARRGPAVRSPAGKLATPLTGVLASNEQDAWDRAIAYYDRELAALDLLFSDPMQAIGKALLATCPLDTPTGLAPEHAAVLAAAAPVYRAHGWVDHDRANRAWIAGAIERVRALSPAVPERLARLYGTPWFTAPVRVDVVIVASRQGAYTSDAPTHITISSSHPGGQGWAAAEVIFHEASHALVDPVEQAFEREAQAAAKQLPVLWHAALFYLTGEVVRQALAARGIEYVPYVYANGLFERGWPQLRVPLETHWRPYVDGQIALDEAVRRVVAAAPSER